MVWNRSEESEEQQKERYRLIVSYGYTNEFIDSIFEKRLEEQIKREGIPRPKVIEKIVKVEDSQKIRELTKKTISTLLKQYEIMKQLEASEQKLSVAEARIQETLVELEKSNRIAEAESLEKELGNREKESLEKEISELKIELIEAKKRTDDYFDRWQKSGEYYIERLEHLRKLYETALKQHEENERRWRNEDVESRA